MPTFENNFVSSLVQNLLLQTTQNFSWTLYYRESYKEFYFNKANKRSQSSVFSYCLTSTESRREQDSSGGLQNGAPWGWLVLLLPPKEPLMRFATMKAQAWETFLKLKAECPLEAKNRNKPTLALAGHLQKTLSSLGDFLDKHIVIHFE